MMTPSRLEYRRGIRDRYADILTAPAPAALVRRTTATVIAVMASRIGTHTS